MDIRYRRFSIGVIVAVTAVGAMFGALTGAVYASSFWWAAAIAGALCGYPLAKFYLNSLMSSSAKRHSEFATWAQGTFVAILCGMACTAVLHGMMMVISYAIGPSPGTELEAVSIWPIILMFGEAIGAAAGLVVGGICSLVYLFSVKASGHEIP